MKEVELYDGTVLEFPDDTPDAVIDQTAQRETKRLRVTAVKQPAAVTAGQTLREIPRQVGLAGRYALEGTAQVADILAEPIRNFVVNPIVNAFGGTPITSQYEAAGRAATVVGLPSPATPNERVVGDMSRFVAGGGAMLGGAMAAAKVPGAVGAVAERMTQGPVLQAASAIGAGGAGGSVREAGGGPLAQFGASLAGGLAAPYALSKLSGPAHVLAGKAAGLFKPRDIEGALKIELQRAGVNWEALGQQARAALVKDAEKAIYTGQPIDAAALRRLADFRNVGATPLMGDITMDPRQLTLQRNLAKQMANTGRPLGGPDLPSLENQNARTVIQTLENAADSPLDTYATGQALGAQVRATDAGMKGVENSLYRQARDSAGRAIPLDRAGFVNQAFDNLTKQNRGPWLPDQVRQVLNTLAKGEGEFTVDTIDQLKTLLAQESRATANGNTKAAISAVRDALENVVPAPSKVAMGSTLPITGETAAKLGARDTAREGLSQESLAAFDKARSFARSRREWQESANFIAAALDDAAPDSFVQAHIIKAPAEELAKVRRFVEKTPELKDAVRKQLIEYIMRRGRVDSDVTKFSSAGMFDGFKELGTRKLGMFFSPEEVGKIRSAINVGRYIQAQPAGSAVNNSNTAAMVWGRLSDILLKGTEIPVIGPLVAQPVRSLAINMQGRQVSNVGNALALPPPMPMPANALLLAAGVPRSD